jgi:hypothetical protein
MIKDMGYGIVDLATACWKHAMDDNRISDKGYGIFDLATACWKHAIDDKRYGISDK